MGHFWLWVMMMSVLVNGWWCSGCWEQERIALLQLKANMNYPNFNYFPLWVDGETADCCAWPEVKCNTTTRRVIQLSLIHTGGRSADWYFNASLFLPFEELRTLHLRNNYLVGWVENEGFDRLSRLRNLEILDLSWNSFNNISILSALSQLSSLKSLSLGGNFLKGSPHSDGLERLSSLSNLEVLDLSYNRLNGRVLSFLNLNDFINLKELDISGNDFQSFGPIHGSERQARLSNLEALNLKENRFNNSLFSSLSGLSSLKFLNIRSNILKGSIHIKELDALSNLDELDISENEVDDFVNSEGIKSLSHLKVLHLNGMINYSNRSNLLQSLRAFSSLKTLYFRYNDFGGTISTQVWRNLSNLEDLFLDHSSPNENFLPSIGVMTSLKFLSLRECRLNGTLPIQGWCELKNLQVLDLSGNNFEGKLPSCLGNLTFLQLIDLSDNRFIGNIASSPLSSLTSLEYLSLSNNQFQVPNSFKLFANHSNLKFIFADNNRIITETKLQTWVPFFQLEVFSLSNCTGHLRLPNFLYYQYDLRILDLSQNNLGGRFPDWLLDNNTRLEGLYLSDNAFLGPFRLQSHPNLNLGTIFISNNNIQGGIPGNISSIFPNLNELRMSKNMLEGNLPPRLGDMKSLVYLDLSNNNLSGVVPEQLAMGCTSLFFLKLSNNKMHGQIFSGSFNLPSLKYLYLNGNNFTSMTPSLSTSPLEVVDVSNNHLSGMLPTWLGNMTTVMVIALSKNDLEGPIPIEFCKLNNLDLLDISQNSLSGSIPSCFNRLSVRHVLLSKNKLEGAFIRAFSSNSSLVTLDLGDNNFASTIPESINSLSGLRILLLKGNHFEGKIPIQLCHLNELSMMDLSHNNLSGSIPHCLGNITSMANGEKPLLRARRFFFIWSTLHLYMDKTKLPRTYHAHQSDWFEAPLINLQVQVEFTTKSISYSYMGDILAYMSGIDLSQNQLTGEIPIELGNLSEIRALNMSHNNLIGTIPTTISNLRQIESLDLSYNNLNGRIPTQLIELNFLAVFSVAHNNLSGSTPNQKAQFATFEESSYEGNPFLCGPPLHISCTNTKSPPTFPNVLKGEGEENGFMDMEFFYVSFIVTYVIVLLEIALVLYINPYWRRAWFHLIEICLTFSYYFVLDHFPLFNNRKDL